MLTRVVRGPSRIQGRTLLYTSKAHRRVCSQRWSIESTCQACAYEASQQSAKPLHTAEEHAINTSQQRENSDRDKSKNETSAEAYTAAEQTSAEPYTARGLAAPRGVAERFKLVADVLRIEAGTFCAVTKAANKHHVSVCTSSGSTVTQYGEIPLAPGRGVPTSLLLLAPGGDACQRCRPTPLLSGRIRGGTASCGRSAARCASCG